MLSARTVFQQIIDNDESFRLFATVAAVGEAQGGWENGRIAALVPLAMHDLAPKIARHGKDEDKHGRIFNALLRKRGLQPCEAPDDVNYTAILERGGIGISHTLLRRDVALDEREVIRYLVHSRVTEQRAAEQIATLRKYFGDDPQLGRAVTQIAADEARHLAYCNEELLALTQAGHEQFIRSELKRTAFAEIAVYRDVSLAVVRRMSAILRWPRAKRAVLSAGIHIVYVYERMFGWRRMVSLKMPVTRNALGT